MKTRVALVLICLWMAGSVQATMTHRYDFSAGPDDVVGGLTSALFGDAVVADGSLVCDGVDDWMEMDAAGIAINTYTTGLTLEMWSTQGPENQSFSLTASFGGTWDNGFGQDYIGISTTRGNDVSRGMIANTPDNDAPWGDEVGVDGPELNDEVEHHYVLTVSDPAADGSGELAYYVDGELQGTAPLNGTTIAGLSNMFAYLGKGIYSVDAEVRCSINEFRIYGAPLTALEVLANYAAGPDEIPVGVVPTSLPLDPANITASASSSNEPDTMGPENTANGSGLNANGQHSTVETDMWLSALGDADPWLQYEFDQVYEIEKMQIWNYNHALEPMVGFGVSDVNIAYSTDGTDWMVIEHVTVEQAPASDTYEGMTVELGIAAQIVRLEINSNRSAMMVDQYGLSEVRFYVVLAQEPELIPVDPGADNLVHQYTFDDGTPNDSVGQANGTLVGDAAVVDGALVVDGVDDWMEIDGAAVAINAYSEVTLELWALESIDNGFTMTASFGGTWENGFGQDYLMIATGRGDQMNRGAIANTPDSDAPWGDEVGVSSPELVDDLWHHYVVTVNATEIAYYVDGSQIGTAALDGTSLAGLSNDFVYLGKGVYTVDPEWAGAIDQFSIYNRALTPGEVLFLAGN